MERIIGIVAALCAGFAIVLQGAINNTLAKYSNSLFAVMMSGLGAGFLAMAVLALRRQLDPWPDVSAAPAWSFLGGIFGLMLLFGIIVAIPRLGAVTTTALLVIAQLGSAAVIDRFGLLNLPARDVGPSRIAGLVVLVVGVSLVSRR